MINCPCCCRAVMLTEGKRLPEHGVLLPVNSYDRCMASGATENDAHILIPVFRAFMQWTNTDTHISDDIKGVSK